jgi:DNA-binding GntR family transcriptional regulator
MNAPLRAPHPGFLAQYQAPAVPGLPKYAQLRETLFNAIRAGHWKPGDKLPTEADLARLTPYSLGTVQRALRSLVEEGLVVRTQGSGTFVAEGRAPIDAPLHLRFLGGEGEPHFLPLYPKVLAKKRVAERGPWSDFLRQRGDEIVRIDRRLSVNGEFHVFNRFYFNGETFPGVRERTVAQLDGVNLKELLASAFRTPVTRIAQRISLVKFAPEACRAIGVKLATHGMLLESEASAARDTPVYFLESYIPPNGRRMDVSPD